MDYAELLKSLADPDLGLQYTLAEKVFNAITYADPDKLLDELESAQYLEPHEIEALLGMPLSELPITGRDVLFAMKTLIHLHQIQVRATPRIFPSWDDIKRTFPVGSVHFGTLIRKIKGGYLIRLSKSDVSFHAFLPEADSIPASFDESSNTRFRIQGLNESKRKILLAIDS